MNKDKPNVIGLM